MSQTGLPHDAVVYPCSDGQPMAETQVHGACMMYVTYALKRWFERQGRADVHVGMNSFLYYEQGNPRAVVAPDVYERRRRNLPAVERAQGAGLRAGGDLGEGARTSGASAMYATLGVSEYFLYDPTAEYLTPPLQGYRLRDGEYRPLPAVTVLSNRGVAVASEVLGLEFRDEREARMVRLRDPATGQDLLSHRESELAREEEAAARRAAEARLAQEAAARQAAEARNAALDARIRDLENALAAPRKLAE